MNSVTVYDVHPGNAGCPEPIPEPLRLAAEAMSGQRLPVQEVVGRLRASVPDGAFDIRKDYISYGSGQQIYMPYAEEGFLMWENNWRVLRIER